MQFNLQRRAAGGTPGNAVWESVKKTATALGLFLLGRELGTYQPGLFLLTRLLAVGVSVAAFPFLSYSLQTAPLGGAGRRRAARHARLPARDAVRLQRAAAAERAQVHGAVRAADQHVDREGLHGLRHELPQPRQPPRAEGAGDVGRKPLRQRGGAQFVERVQRETKKKCRRKCLFGRHRLTRIIERTTKDDSGCLPGVHTPLSPLSDLPAFDYNFGKSLQSDSSIILWIYLVPPTIRYVILCPVREFGPGGGGGGGRGGAEHFVSILLLFLLLQLRNCENGNIR